MLTRRETTVSPMGYWLHLARAKHPDRPAVEGPGRALTYAQLSEAAIAGARALAGRELPPDARVALALADPVEFVIALHACLLAGHAVVPVDLRLSEAERAQRMAGAEVVVTGPLEGDGM